MTMNYRIQTGDQTTAEILENKLLSSLQQTLPQANNQQFVFQILSEDQQLVAGLTASTSYGWLLIKVLWVRESHRQRGLASQLLQKAETQALDRGCHAAWLDTSNPVAKDFYLKKGFEIFGKLGNEGIHHPQCHQRWFMKKSL